MNRDINASLNIMFLLKTERLKKEASYEMEQYSIQFSHKYTGIH